MASFLRRIFSAIDSSAKKKKDVSISINVLGKEYTVKSSNINLSDEDLAKAKDRRALKYKRYERMMRHKKIWAVLNYAKCLEAIYNSNNFYDLDKAILDYNRSVERFDQPDFAPSDVVIDCAFRFCDIQYSQKKCGHNLTDDEKHIITNWKSHSLDYIDILKNVSERFMCYWDGVVDNYLQNSDKEKRIEYLINHLEEVKYRKGLSSIPQLENYLSELKTH